LLTGVFGTLVKKLKVERKEQIYIENNNFLTFKTWNTQFPKKMFSFILHPFQNISKNHFLGSFI